MAEFLQGIDDALADEMLARVEEQQFFERRLALPGSCRGENKVHERFLL
jgi:hypothetical protein